MAKRKKKPHPEIFRRENNPRSGSGTAIVLRGYFLNGHKLPRVEPAAILLAAVQKMQDIIDVVTDRWKWYAQRTLHSMRQQYLDALQPLPPVVRGTKVYGEIQLVGKLPNMIENGNPSYDLKESILKSPKAHTSEHDPTLRWVNVPYRWRFSKTSGTSGGQVLPPDIAAAIKKAFKDDEDYLGDGVIRDNPTTGYRHAVSIYANPRKYTYQYETKRESKVFTFRRVSKNSSPLAWWHPGFPGIHLADKVAYELEHIILDMMENP